MQPSAADLLIARDSYDAERALDAWRWLVGDDCVLREATLFGHCFLRFGDDRYCLLDIWSGDLYVVAEGEAAFSALMDGADPEGIDLLLMPQLAHELRAAGMKLRPGECYCPFVSPGLGGSLTPKNFLAGPFVVQARMAAAELAALRCVATAD